MKSLYHKKLERLWSQSNKTLFYTTITDWGPGVREGCSAINAIVDDISYKLTTYEEYYTSLVKIKYEKNFDLKFY